MLIAAGSEDGTEEVRQRLTGKTTVIAGPSGAGKSTLLHVTGLLEPPDEGEVFLSGAPCSDMDDATRTKMRREYLGFVYQNHNLQPEFSALENVMIPQMIAGKRKREAAEYAEFLLDKVGLKKRMNHRPAQLSGGEAQRVAIARALANKPHMLLADEPNIREVILFPMNGMAQDLMMQAPCEVTPQQLKELHIKIDMPKEIMVEKK
jgi:ABC-type lipoprotein export system ATPase subunit